MGKCTVDKGRAIVYLELMCAREYWGLGRKGELRPSHWGQVEGFGGFGANGVLSRAGSHGNAGGGGQVRRL